MYLLYHYQYGMLRNHSIPESPVHLVARPTAIHGNACSFSSTFHGIKHLLKAIIPPPSESIVSFFFKEFLLHPTLFLILVALPFHSTVLFFPSNYSKILVFSSGIVWCLATYGIFHLSKLHLAIINGYTSQLIDYIYSNNDIDTINKNCFYVYESTLLTGAIEYDNCTFAEG